MSQDWLTWQAAYDDGSFLNQYDGEKENSYHSIDRSKLVGFSLIDPTTDTAVFMMELLEDQRLVYRKRIGMDAQSGQEKYFIYLVGWQQTVGDKNVQALHWVFPDGSILSTGRFREDNPLLSEITWLDEEK